MKKYIVIIVLVCLLPIYAQTSDSSNIVLINDSVLVNAKKDYLYRLEQLNYGTILKFIKVYSNLQFTQQFVGKKVLNVDLQIKNVENMSFSIREKCDSAAIRVDVYFILLKNTDGFIKKSNRGEIIPSKRTTFYRWALKDELLNVVFTTTEFSDRFQNYLPEIE